MDRAQGNQCSVGQRSVPLLKHLPHRLLHPLAALTQLDCLAALLLSPSAARTAVHGRGQAHTEVKAMGALGRGKDTQVPA